MKKKDYYLRYTICFLLLALITFYWFIINGKSLVYHSDGLLQHYTALTYYGRYLREILRTLFVDHRLSIPMWDFNIGLGNDILTTLNYYVMGDPLTLLSALVPSRYTEYLYGFLIILRMYLAGITFSMFCRYLNFNSHSTLIGSMVYLFTSYTFYAGFSHPFFLNPLIYLPLILLGIEKIYHRESPALFIFSVFLSAVSNFYFFYMLTIFMFFYGVYRYVVLCAKKKEEHLPVWFGRFVLCYLTGLGCSCILFLPNAMAILQSNRMQTDYYVPVFYSADYYRKFLSGFLGPVTDPYCYMGYSAIALVAILVLFNCRKRHTGSKVALLGGILLLLIPYAGHALNGFSYVTNRWIWLFQFIVAMIVVIALPEIPCLPFKKKLLCLPVAALYSLLMYWGNTTQRSFCTGILICFWCSLLVLLFLPVRCNSSWVRSTIPVACIGFGLLVNITFLYAPDQMDQTARYMSKGTCQDALATHPAIWGKAATSEGNPRIDTVQVSHRRMPVNAPMIYGSSGTSFYFSNLNNYTAQFLDEMYLNHKMGFYFLNLDGRSYLNSLCGSEYIAISKKHLESRALPYGYSENIAQKRGLALMHSSCSLPFSYTYDTAVAQEDYDKMTVTQKQQALLQSCVINDAAPLLPEKSLTFTDREIPFTIDNPDGVAASDHSFHVTKDNASVTLSFQSDPDSETYVIFQKLDYVGENPHQSEAVLQLDDGRKHSRIIYKNRYDRFYSGPTNRLCNLGFSTESRNSITISFRDRGIYSYDRLQIICQPMKDFSHYTSALKQTVLQNVTTDANTIRGTITSDKEKVLCLTIPYSRGWSASLDGRRVTLHRINTGYTGVLIPAGDHRLSLHYRTPYLSVGIFLSLMGCILALILCKIRRTQATDGRPHLVWRRNTSGE